MVKNTKAGCQSSVSHIVVVLNVDPIFSLKFTLSSSLPSVIRVQGSCHHCSDRVPFFASTTMVNPRVSLLLKAVFSKMRSVCAFPYFFLLLSTTSAALLTRQHVFASHQHQRLGAGESKKKEKKGGRIEYENRKERMKGKGRNAGKRGYLYLSFLERIMRCHHFVHNVKTSKISIAVLLLGINSALPNKPAVSISRVK